MPAGTSYTFKDGMLSEKIVKCTNTQTKETYYRIGIKNQFLHAVHPIGWIKKLEIELDGEAVEEKNIYFVLRGQWFAASKMYTISEVFWNLCEEAQVYFDPGKEISGGKHHVKCTFTMSMLEDTQVLDLKCQWPFRVEFVDGCLEVCEEDAK